MAYYESVFLARQDVSGAVVDNLTDQFSKIIEDNGGRVTKKESWGLRTLAYRIKKNRKGHYVLLNIDAPPAAVAELERSMGLHEDVIRFLTTRVEALEDGPSAMVQSRGGRDRRRHDSGGDGARGGSQSGEGDKK